MALFDEDVALRTHAATLLAEIGAARPLTRVALHDPEQAVRLRAVEALGAPRTALTLAEAQPTVNLSPP